MINIPINLPVDLSPIKPLRLKSSSDAYIAYHKTAEVFFTYRFYLPEGHVAYSRIWCLPASETKKMFEYGKDIALGGTPMSYPLRSTKDFHRKIEDGGTPRVVRYENGEIESKFDDAQEALNDLELHDGLEFGVGWEIAEYIKMPGEYFVMQLYDSRRNSKNGEEHTSSWVLLLPPSPDDLVADKEALIEACIQP